MITTVEAPRECCSMRIARAAPRWISTGVSYKTFWADCRLRVCHRPDWLCWLRESWCIPWIWSCSDRSLPGRAARVTCSRCRGSPHKLNTWSSLQSGSCAGRRGLAHRDPDRKLTPKGNPSSSGKPWTKIHPGGLIGTRWGRRNKRTESACDLAQVTQTDLQLPHRLGH